MKPKYITVLEALDLGISVNIGGEYDIVFGVDEKGNEVICFQYSNRLIVADFQINHFISACNKLSDDRITELNANIALNKIKKKVRMHA